MGDCAVCGYPTLRHGGHADWCEWMRTMWRYDAWVMDQRKSGKEIPFSWETKTEPCSS